MIGEDQERRTEESSLPPPSPSSPFSVPQLAKNHAVGSHSRISLTAVCGREGGAGPLRLLRTLLLERRRAALVLFLRQFAELWHCSLLCTLEGFPLARPVTFIHSCVSLLLQVKYHHRGEHQNGQSANSCGRCFTLGRKKGSGAWCLLLLRSRTGIALYITKMVHSASVSARTGSSVDLS